MVKVTPIPAPKANIFGWIESEGRKKLIRSDIWVWVVFLFNGDPRQRVIHSLRQLTESYQVTLVMPLSRNPKTLLSGQ